MKKITPNLDLQNSIERDRILESRDFYKGKSFRYSSWCKGHTYYNNDLYQDFISIDNVLLACKKTHVASKKPEITFEQGNYTLTSSDWTIVMAASPGENGQVYVPSYDAKTGQLSWTLQEHTSEIEPVTINTTVSYVNVLDEDPNDYVGRLVIDSTTKNLYTAIASGDVNKWQLVGGSNNTNPGVACPISSVDDKDKILSLDNGKLKSSLTFSRETIDGKEYLVIRGKDREVIGKVATAEFTVDGILDDVKFSTEEGKENTLVLTFNTSAGKQPIEVDFSKYVDVYRADEGLILNNNTFKIDFTKVPTKYEIAALQEALDKKADKSEIGTLTKVDGGSIQWG